MIKNLKIHYHQSLSFKLMVAFLLAVVFALSSLIAVVWYWDQYETSAVIASDQSEFIITVVEDIGVPPNHQRARKIADYTNNDIYIVSESGIWSSRQTSLPKALEELEYHPLDLGDETHEPEYQLLYSFGEHDELIFLWKNSQYSMYIVERIYFESIAIRPILGVLAAVMLVVLLGYYALTRHLFSPLQTITKSIERYVSGDMTHRIELHSRNEFGQLADQLDRMSDEVQAMLDAKRQLLLAISHELRTPITRANISLAMMEDSAYKQDVQNDLREINVLVSGLLEGERLNEPHQALNLTRVSINQLLHEVVSGFDGHEIRFTPLADDVETCVDLVRMQLLVRNLLTNALQYGRRENSVEGHVATLDVAVNAQQLCLSVTDQGEGIEQRHLTQLVEPFYRVDSSRQRQSGGYGLGLYLCRMIAQAHGGSLTVSSTVGQGTQITVTVALTDS